MGAMRLRQCPNDKRHMVEGLDYRKYGNKKFCCKECGAEWEIHQSAVNIRVKNLFGEIKAAWQLPITAYPEINTARGL
jgi:hypothetical protein